MSDNNEIESKFNKFLPFVYWGMSIIMILLEQILSIFDLDRFYFYLFLTPGYLYVFVKYVATRGIDSTKLGYGGVSFSIEQKQFKFLTALILLIITLIAPVLYSTEFIFRLFIIRQSYSIGILSFQQFTFLNLMIVAILVKVFGTDESSQEKYLSNKTKYISYANLTFLSLIPAYLMKGTINISKGNLIPKFEDRISLIFSSELNFIQHLILVIIAFIAILMTSRKNLNDFLTENNKNKLAAFLILLSYLAYDLVALTLSERKPSNMIKQVEIITFTASTLILISAGLTLTTRVRKFGNFAHAEFLTVGLYMVILIRSYDTVRDLVSFSIGPISIFGGDNIFGWMVFAFIGAGLVGILGEILVFSPLERRDAVPLTLMVGSIGLGLVIRQSIQEFFGGTNQNAIAPQFPNWFNNFENKIIGIKIGIITLIDLSILLGLSLGIGYAVLRAKTNFEKVGSVILGTFVGFAIGNFLGIMFSSNLFPIITFGTLRVLGKEYVMFDDIDVIIPVTHIWSVIIMILIVMMLRFIFVFTTLGISMRATADDEELAQISGINTRRVIFYTWFIAGGVAGIGALWRFEASNIVPFSGFSLLLIIFAVVILGGFDSFEGTLISAFIVASVQALTTIINGQLVIWEKENEEIDRLVFWTAKSDWSQVIPFAIIIIVLLFRPRGIYGVVDPRSKL